MATRKSTTSAFPRVSFESECKRVRVVAEAHRDYALFLDDRYSGSYTMSIEAEHEGLAWLNEQAAELAIELADSSASYTPPVLDRYQNVTVELQADGTLWVSEGEKDTKLTRPAVIALMLAFKSPHFSEMLLSVLEDHICATGSPALQGAIVTANNLIKAKAA